MSHLVWRKCARMFLWLSKFCEERPLWNTSSAILLAHLHMMRVLFTHVTWFCKKILVTWHYRNERVSQSYWTRRLLLKIIVVLMVLFVTNFLNLRSTWSNIAELPQMLGVWESWQILSGGRRDVVLRKSHSRWSLILRTSDWSVCCTGTICPLGETWLLPLCWLLHLFDLSLKVNQSSP